MTRETKLGLVVSGSFLCLLGALVAHKLLREQPAGDAGKNPVVSNAGTGQTSPKDRKIKPQPKSNAANPTSNSNSKLKQASFESPAKLPNLFPNPLPPKKLPSGKKTSFPPTKLPGFPGPQSNSAAGGTSPSIPKIPDLANIDTKENKIDPTLELLKKKAAEANIQLPPPDKLLPESPPGGSITGINVVQNPKLPNLPKQLPKGAPKKVPNVPPAGGEANKPGIPALPGLPPAPPPPPETKTDGKKPNKPKVELPVLPKSPSNKKASKKTAAPQMPPPPEVKLPAFGGNRDVGRKKKTKSMPKIPPVQPVSNKGKQSPDSSIGKTPKLPGVPPAIPDTTTNGKKKIALPKNNTRVSIPNVGEKSTVTTPELKIQTPNTVSRIDKNSGVKVTDYQMRMDRCAPNTLTFAALSQKHYYSNNYAQALLRFNRDNNPNAGGLRQDPPRLQVGDLIMVPPTDVLEGRYGADIPNLKQLPSTPPIQIRPFKTNQNATVRKPSQLPVSPDAGQNPVPKKPVWQNASIKNNGRVYVVQRQGEMLFQIAREMLGNGRRWPEIYRLNPQIRPEYPIPPGTQLTMPLASRSPR